MFRLCAVCTFFCPKLPRVCHQPLCSVYHVVYSQRIKIDSARVAPSSPALLAAPGGGVAAGRGASRDADVGFGCWSQCQGSRSRERGHASYTAGARSRLLHCGSAVPPLTLRERGPASYTAGARSRLLPRLCVFTKNIYCQRDPPAAAARSRRPSARIAVGWALARQRPCHAASDD